VVAKNTNEVEPAVGYTTRPLVLCDKAKSLTAQRLNRFPHLTTGRMRYSSLKLHHSVTRDSGHAVALIRVPQPHRRIGCPTVPYSGESGRCFRTTVVGSKEFKLVIEGVGAWGLASGEREPPTTAEQTWRTRTQPNIKQTVLFLLSVRGVIQWSPANTLGVQVSSSASWEVTSGLGIYSLDIRTWTRPLCSLLSQ
jgi:hypothetical protein